jgi:site-specific DNA-cytosine methylase
VIKTSVNVLELFAGTKSIGKVAKELGYNVFSTDIEEKFQTDYTIDLLEFDVNEVPWKPDIIWASPPCTSFSINSHRHHWDKDKQPLTETAIVGYKLIEKTIELINYFEPKYWYIENPRGLLRDFEIMKKLPIRNTVNYCQYKQKRKKPTDIWTNNNKWIPKPLCKTDDCIHNEERKIFEYMNTVDIATIPSELCFEILLSK